MNIQKVREILKSYKANFAYLNNQELYKWQITKRFQDSWNIRAPNFYEMVNSALATSKNLLASGNYFARRMLLLNTAQYPEEVRQLFIDLFDEEADLVKRIEDFRRAFRSINDRTYPGRNPYQDHRALLVYLSLNFPDSYYLYKFEMFRAFVGLVEYPYTPRQGRIENITNYMTMCNLLKEEILQDSELLKLHRTRIGPTEFFDSSYNILTQDVIYAATFHLPKILKVASLPPASSRLIRTDETIAPKKQGVSLSGSFVNYLDLERERKRIGDLGELLVLEWERERLQRLGLRHEPVHVAATAGDGLGYDVLSFDEDGREIYIEVKNTTGGAARPFFVTHNELHRSLQNPESFLLYRLYEFDPVRQTAKFFLRAGSLEDLCQNPVLFKVVSG